MERPIIDSIVVFAVPVGTIIAGIVSAGCLNDSFSIA